MSKTVTLCGGPFDAHTVKTDYRPNYLQTAVGSEIAVYVARKYVSGYPIEGWELVISYDAMNDAPGHEAEAYVPWWTTIVFATEERHEEIELAFGPLNDALLAMDRLRTAVAHDDVPAVVRDEIFDQEQRRIEAALATIYLLTNAKGCLS